MLCSKLIGVEKITAEYMLLHFQKIGPPNRSMEGKRRLVQLGGDHTR